MKKKQNKAVKTYQIMKSALRPGKVRQGFFDGRFYTRAIRSRKKELSRLACRKFNQSKQIDES